ncbi:methionine ABC transporter ATP-binding protein [Parasphingorhabdus pacifica]
MITVQNITKTYSHDATNVVALDNVSMEVPAGSVSGIVGSSGSGKSTLARCIALQEKPDVGEVRIDGTNLAALDERSQRAARREIGVVPRREELLRQRTAAGNVALPLEAAGVAGPQRRARVAELLDLVGLTEQAPAYPERLTAGQLQRVAIARALATRPSVLVADEPTTGLDPASTDSVLTVLERARSELGATVVIATDDMAVVRRIADDVTVLEEGHVVEHGKALDLVAEPGSHIGSALLPETDQAQVLKQAGTRHDVVAEVVLVGFAAVGALLPEASSRFDVELSVLGGGLTRLGETPVAKFRVGLSGERSESALKWMIEHDAQVRRTPVCVERVAAA